MKIKYSLIYKHFRNMYAANIINDMLVSRAPKVSLQNYSSIVPCAMTNCGTKAVLEILFIKAGYIFSIICNRITSPPPAGRSNINLSDEETIFVSLIRILGLFTASSPSLYIVAV